MSLLSTACLRLRSPPLRRSERLRRRATCFQLGPAAQTPPRFNRVPDSLSRLARALFLHLSNCLPTHHRADAAAGAGNTDFARRPGIARALALGGSGRSRAHYHNTATTGGKISGFAANSASPFLRQSSANIENTSSTDARSQYSKLRRNRAGSPSASESECQRTRAGAQNDGEFCRSACLFGRSSFRRFQISAHPP